MMSWEEFWYAMNNANLFPIDAKGSFVTWARRGAASGVECKLDGSFCNQVHLDLRDEVSYISLPRHCRNILYLF